MVSGIMVSGKTTVSRSGSTGRSTGISRLRLVGLDDALFGLAHGSGLDLDVDLLHLGLVREQRQPDLEHAVVVGRVRLVDVDVDGQADAPLEGAVVHLDLLVDAPLAAGELAPPARP